MNKSFPRKFSSDHRRIKGKSPENLNVSSVNCDNKTNHCSRDLSDALLSGQNRGKLSIDDESSHPINGSNTNNKSERKRNINMLCDGYRKGEGVAGEGDARVDLKRIKVDGNVDGQDDNKTKMYQVSRGKMCFPSFLSSDFSPRKISSGESSEMYLITAGSTNSSEINFDFTSQHNLCLSSHSSHFQLYLAELPAMGAAYVRRSIEKQNDNIEKTITYRERSERIRIEPTRQLQIQILGEVKR